MEDKNTLWDIDSMREQTEKEIENEELYKEFFKENCCLCNAKIPGNWEHYKRLGNACSPCTSRVDMVSKNHITKEVADEMFLKRIEQVKSGEYCLQYDYVKKRMVLAP